MNSDTALHHSRPGRQGFTVPVRRFVSCVTRVLQSLWLVATLTWSLALNAQQNSDQGVLIMAHGGTPEWNQGVLDTIASLHTEHTVEVAFGMADALSIQDAVSRLEARGARSIAVVRLFISGESWYDRTAQILGLQEGAPVRPATADHTNHVGHGAAGAMPHRMEFWRIDTQSRFALSQPGLAEAPQMSEVLVSRAQSLSQNPAGEDVLILAHGPDTDAENARWLAFIDARAQSVRDALPFPRVQVATLREDWQDKRVEAERQIRAFVAQTSAEGRTALVIPYRVHGFGPYAEVLEGLDYRADATGLIPHPGVTQWIEEQIAVLRAQLQDG